MRDALAEQIGTLAVLGLARTIRQEVPAAAYADLAWTTEGDAAFMEPTGAYYGADGPELCVAEPADLRTRLQRYSALLDETNLGAWSDLVSDEGADGRPLGDDIRRLDVEAALALPQFAARTPPGQPARLAVVAQAAQPAEEGYTVSFEYSAEGVSGPLEAAMQAYRALTDPQSPRPVATVTGPDGQHEEIDLAAEEC